MRWSHAAVVLSSLILSHTPLTAQEAVVPDIVILEEPPSPRLLDRYWFNASFEAGRVKSPWLPPMVVANGAIVAGGERLRTPSLGGFRFTAGAWLEPTRIHGIDASVDSLNEGRSEATYFVGDTPSYLPVVQGNGEPGFFPLAGPDVGIGAFQVLHDIRYQTADVNYRHACLRDSVVSIDVLAGYRYAHLGEGLHLYNKRMGGDGFLIRTKDHLSTSNQFHGGQIGLAGEVRHGPMYFSLMGKLAIGAVASSTLAEGGFRVNGNVDPFGFYTRPALAGMRSHCDFALMPTLNAATGWQCSEHTRIFVGVNFQYLSTVIRPQDMLDLVPEWNGNGDGSHRDAGRSDFWAITASLGMEWRY